MRDGNGEPERYSSTRPYACESCGGSMRTRGIGGLCISCAHPTPLRCAHCARVKFCPPEYSVDWQDHPGRVPGEIEVQCATCMEMRRKAAEVAYWRNARAVARRAREPHEVKAMTDAQWADLTRGE